jgi:hypothetical protein
MKEINNKNSNLIYLPSLKNAVFINSKIEYLKILNNVIDKSTLLVEAPLEINIDKVIEYKNNYEEGNLVYPLEKICVIKTPFAGGSSCVVSIPNIEPNENKSYEYWLGIFIKKSKHKKIKCSGFSTGLIIQNYNDFFSEIGEFRCFCVNGIIIAIIYSFYDEFHLIAHRKNLFNKNDDLKIKDLGKLKIVENEINKIKENIKNRYNNNNNNNYNLDNKINLFNNLKYYLEQFEQICNYVKEKFDLIGQPLNINRIDLVISSDSTLINPNFIVNEVEDFSCGPASTYPVNTLINNNNIDIMFKFKQILAKLYFNSLIV